ncbi:protein ALP1-like [Haliotis rubra]|uniref:protein ALP1-like n=1 Tax=Haliotis rubra TaxID=36100 RepID=UPI001EE61582|nr:protein ALP1-like [Haliotis rubra]
MKNLKELITVISGFQQKWNFPNCGGAIDATHIPIVAPQQFHSDTVNRKGFYSIIMQAVCDDKYRFTDVCIGWPGRVHDARVFSNSKLRALADSGDILPQTAEMMDSVGPADHKVDMPVVLIADPAYPMCPWLLKPYSNRGALTEEQSYFNYRLSSARMTIENTFGRLKGRWRRFSKRIYVHVEFVPVLTAASQHVRK